MWCSRSISTSFLSGITLGGGNAIVIRVPPGERFVRAHLRCPLPRSRLHCQLSRLGLHEHIQQSMKRGQLVPFSTRTRLIFWLMEVPPHASLTTSLISSRLRRPLLSESRVSMGRLAPPGSAPQSGTFLMTLAIVGPSRFRTHATYQRALFDPVASALQSADQGPPRNLLCQLWRSRSFCVEPRQVPSYYAPVSDDQRWHLAKRPWS
jgi:hypothetical protein